MSLTTIGAASPALTSGKVPERGVNEMYAPGSVGRTAGEWSGPAGVAAASPVSPISDPSGVAASAVMPRPAPRTALRLVCLSMSLPILFTRMTN